MNRMLGCLLWCFFSGLSGLQAEMAGACAADIYQFYQEGEYTYPGSKPQKARAYLWIPENCRQIRGLLILCANCPEERIAGHPGIRKVCAANSLGVVYFAGSFMQFKQYAKLQAEEVAFMQQILTGLAAVSGYTEIASAPLLPIGESMHNKMVDALVDQVPDRCIAGVYYNDANIWAKTRSVPIYANQNLGSPLDRKKDLREQWRGPQPFYGRRMGALQKEAAWPFSLMVEPSGGHLPATAEGLRYLAAYIDAAAKARLSAQGPALKPVSLASGYLATLPMSGYQAYGPVAYPEAQAAQKKGFWYFTRELAQQAIDLANVNWRAEFQLPAYLDLQGAQIISSVEGLQLTNVPYQITDPDGITFAIKTGLFPTLPATYVGAGEALAQAPGKANVEIYLYPLRQQPEGNFQICLGGSAPGPCYGYLTIHQPGTDRIRASYDVGASLSLRKNDAGQDQVITFPPMAAVIAGTPAIPLTAVSNSGMKVRYYVDYGPAVVSEDGTS